MQSGINHLYTKYVPNYLISLALKQKDFRVGFPFLDSDYTHITKKGENFGEHTLTIPIDDFGVKNPENAEERKLGDQYEFDLELTKGTVAPSTEFNLDPKMKITNLNYTDPHLLEKFFPWLFFLVIFLYIYIYLGHRWLQFHIQGGDDIQKIRQDASYVS